MIGKEKLDGPHRLLDWKVILLAGPPWGRKEHRPRIFMFIGKLSLWFLSPPPLTFFYECLYLGLLVQLSIYVYWGFFLGLTLEKLFLYLLFLTLLPILKWIAPKLRFTWKILNMMRKKKEWRVCYCLTEKHNLFSVHCEEWILLLYIKFQPGVIYWSKVIIETLAQT